MVQSQFSLSWDSHKTNICSGFSTLQQNGEFIDMTLAADGHFVKVHQVLLALASPYLKDLLTSAPCQHPVIFLNNISYTTLSFLLEYIYTGEVLVPGKHLATFVTAAKALHIKGLETIESHENITVSSLGNSTQNKESEECFIDGLKRLIPKKDSLGQINLPVTARKILIKHEPIPDTSIRSTKPSSNTSFSKDDSHGFSDLEDTGANDHDDDDDDDEYCPPTKITSTPEQGKAPATANTNLQFTVSIRGSLQVILNRYMYNLNSTQSTGVKRWRCIDYRNKKCLAFLVTKGNVVLNRANLHSHSYHDKKILAKIEKNAVFSALGDAEGYKEKENSKDVEDTAMESEDYSSFDISRDMNEKSTPTPHISLQYTVSIRGSLQLILNRYIYNLKSTKKSGLRRWRCIEYRDKKCMASLVTRNNVIINRAHLHSHFYHDRKILIKAAKDEVFSTLVEAERLQAEGEY